MNYNQETTQYTNMTRGRGYRGFRGRNRGRTNYIRGNRTYYNTYNQSNQTQPTQNENYDTIKFCPECNVISHNLNECKRPKN